ncbi:hypothetical protein [Mesorhizobium sp. KR1-2]|uniref:hypothetical protein n=1 Tax=Mesorhizobium sp. KR1-2 TaxID=3156609 RepID=UPI0032B39D07
MKALDIARLRRLVDTISNLLADESQTARGVIGHLVEVEGAGLTEGAEYRLRLAGVTTTCTAGHHGLLRNWQNAARRQIERRVGE